MSEWFKEHAWKRFWRASSSDTDTPRGAFDSNGLRRQRVPRCESVNVGAELSALDVYGTLPLAFVQNQGQTDPQVRFLAQTGGASVFFTPNEAVFAFRRANQGLALRLAFLGAHPEPLIAGASPYQGKVNYLVGGDRARWRTGLPTYGEIIYRQVWPGIDVAFRGGNGQIKYCRLRGAPSR